MPGEMWGICFSSAWHDTEGVPTDPSVSAVASWEGAFSPHRHIVFIASLLLCLL